MKTIAGVVVVAAAATLGDFIWFTFGVRHTTAAGLIHGALLLTVVGGVIGAASRHVVKGLPIGAIAGLGGAVAYYALIRAFDSRPYGSAIPAAWVMMWLLLAALDGRWLRAPRARSWAEVAVRGATAAAGAGVAFYLVMNTLWGRPPAGGRNYAVQLVAWMFAWAPGILALTIGQSRRPSRAPVPAAEHVTAAPAVREEAGVEPDAPVSAVDLLARIDRGEALNILDVRSEGEFAAGHVPGAVNVPFTQVLSRMDDVPGAAADELIVYCGHGPRAYMAAAALRRGGRTNIVYLRGHWAAWQDAGLRADR